jgi:hypothetical protein
MRGISLDESVILGLDNEPAEGVHLGRVAVPVIGLVLEAPINLVVVLDHGQFLLLVVFSEVGFGDLLFVDEVVDLEGVAHLHLYADHVVYHIASYYLTVRGASVEEGLAVVERDEVDRNVPVELVLLVESVLLPGKFIDAVQAKAFNAGLLLLLVLLLVVVLTGEDAQGHFVEEVAQHFPAVDVVERHSDELGLPLRSVLDAHVVDAARAVEVAHHLPLHRFLQLVVLARVFPAVDLRQLSAEILS